MKEEKEMIKKEIEVKKEGSQVANLVVPKNMGDLVTNTMKEYMQRGLVLPEDYNVENAVISSFLIIKQDPKLANCTKDSIASALVDMATMGLNASKKQCYFIPYGGQLKLSPSYFGKIMALKRIKGVIDIVSDVIYEDTEYELSVDSYGNDLITIIKPCPLQNRKLDKIVGAWATIILDEKVWGRDKYTTLMTMEQIEKSWGQGATKGKSPAHLNFREEMSKKSVINRCSKNFVNSAKDQDVLIETFVRTTENDYLDVNDKPRVVKETKVIDL